ncbi:hypothetical protein HDV03_004523 [Kappamyces sp. JEL0829]|nr:hypothetical protein HDV03_004523 [Kappamyces sp. JEL0829]
MAPAADSRHHKSSKSAQDEPIPLPARRKSALSKLLEAEPLPKATTARSSSVAVPKAAAPALPSSDPAQPSARSGAVPWIPAPSQSTGASDHGATPRQPHPGAKSAAANRTSVFSHAVAGQKPALASLGPSKTTRSEASAAVPERRDPIARAKPKPLAASVKKTEPVQKPAPQAVPYSVLQSISGRPAKPRPQSGTPIDLSDDSSVELDKVLSAPLKSPKKPAGSVFNSPNRSKGTDKMHLQQSFASSLVVLTTETNTFKKVAKGTSETTPGTEHGKPSDKRTDAVLAASAGQQESISSPVPAQNEVYEVEKILDFRHTPDGDCVLIKWKGYPDDDNTWEYWAQMGPFNCAEQLRQYWLNKQKTEDDQLEKKKRQYAGAFSSKKQKLNPSDSSPTVPARVPEISLNGATYRNESSLGSSWDGVPLDDHIDRVESISNTDGGLLVFAVWKDGKKTFHAKESAKKRFPQKLLDYFESNLVFS